MSEFIDELKSDVAEAANTAEQSKEALLNGAENAVEEVKSSLSTNPVPYVAGALALGVVIGLLIPREKPVPRLLDGRLEELKDLLVSLKSRLSTTAEDGYSDVSAVLGDVVKKAKKRFNLS